MPVAILVLVLAVYAYVMVTEPRIRIPGLVLGLLAAGGLTWYFLTTPSEQERAAGRIAAEDLRLDLLDLEATPRGALLSGRVENLSADARLRELTIGIKLFDCPEPEAAFADCATIAESRAIARVDVPPGQLRGFTAHYLFTDQPPVMGTLRWDHEILGLRATE